MELDYWSLPQNNTCRWKKLRSSWLRSLALWIHQFRASSILSCQALREVAYVLVQRLNWMLATQAVSASQILVQSIWCSIHFLSMSLGSHLQLLTSFAFHVLAKKFEANEGFLDWTQNIRKHLYEDLSQLSSIEIGYSNQGVPLRCSKLGEFRVVDASLQ